METWIQFVACGNYISVDSVAFVVFSPVYVYVLVMLAFGLSTLSLSVPSWAV